jgi:hypothetical protein
MFILMGLFKPISQTREEEGFKAVEISVNPANVSQLSRLEIDETRVTKF